MHKIFTRTTVTDDNTQVSDSSFKDYYGGINRSMYWNTIKPIIDGAFDDYILPYLGQDLVDDVIQDYIDDNAPTAKEVAFCEGIARALAFYTVYDGMPQQNFQFADMGITEQSGMQSNSMAVSSWRYKNSRWEIMTKADRYLDMALAFLESEVEDGNADFDSWKNSDFYNKNASDFIRKTEEVQQFKDINGSRRMLSSLIPFFKKAESRYVKTILCKDQYDQLKSNYQGNSLTATEELLLPYVQNVVVEYGVYLALPHLRIDVNADGLRIVRTTDDMNIRNDAYDSAIMDLQGRIKEDAVVAQGDLSRFLVENLDDYPLFKDSDCYCEDDEDCHVVTAGDGGIFI